jgi:hypothetical protein
MLRAHHPFDLPPGVSLLLVSRKEDLVAQPDALAIFVS